MTILIKEYNAMALALKNTGYADDKSDAAICLNVLRANHLEITSNLQFAHDIIRRHAETGHIRNPIYKSALLYLPRNKVHAADVLSQYIIAVKSGDVLVGPERIALNLLNKAIIARKYVTSVKMDKFNNIEYDALLDSLLDIGFLDWHWVKEFELNRDSVIEEC